MNTVPREHLENTQSVFGNGLSGFWRSWGGRKGWMCVSKTLAGNREIIFGVQDEF